MTIIFRFKYVSVAHSDTTIKTIKAMLNSSQEIGGSSDNHIKIHCFGDELYLPDLTCIPDFVITAIEITKH